MTGRAFPGWVVSALGHGRRNPEVVDVLRREEANFRKLQLALVMTEISADTGDLGTHEAETPAIAGRVTAAAPLILDDVLLSPEAGMWLAGTLAEMHVLGLEPRVHRRAMRGVAAVAAAVALRSGQEATVVVDVHEGTVFLPTLGRIGVGQNVDAVLLRTGPPLQLAAQPREMTEPKWRTPAPARWPHTLSATADGVSVSLVLDHDSPHRIAYGAAIADPLDDAAMHTWERHFSQAWDLILRFARPEAEALAAGMVVAVVPLTTLDNAQSTTLSNAVGVLSSTPPRHGEEFAGTLIHEAQHSKLWALMHVVDLCHRDKEDLGIVVPWKRDSRPPRGALQGAFAFLALAEFEASMAAATRDASRTEAAGGIARGVEGALDALEQADVLTRSGHQLVAGMRERLHTLRL